MRHIYRQQRFWGDIADKQPEKEQYACLAMFLGIANEQFSEQYGELVEKRKKYSSLKAAKRPIQFNFGTNCGKGYSGEEVQVTPTRASIDVAISRLTKEVEDIQK